MGTLWILTMIQKYNIYNVLFCFIVAVDFSFVLNVCHNSHLFKRKSESNPTVCLYSPALIVAEYCLKANLAYI